MRLTTKLVVALLAGVLLLLVLDGYLSVVRLIHLFQTDMERDARGVALSLRGVLAELVEEGQEDRVREFIEEVNRYAETIEVRWSSPDSLPEPWVRTERAGGAAADSMGAGVRALWLRDGESALHTYAAVRSRSGKLLGVLEIIESRAALNRYARSTVLRRVALVLVLLLVSSGVMVLLGVTIVGRPLGKLIEGTRRIGAGDLNAKVHLAGHDELDELARAMNTMVDRLRASRDDLQAESTRRIVAIEQLRHADKLRTVGRLASGIAHELGTPLNVVSGRATMIEEGGLTLEEQAESARVIRAQANRMARIVRQLLDFARRPRAERTPIELHECTTQIHRLLEPLAGRKRLSLVFDGTGDSPWIVADRSQIEQVLTNLVMNAIQASSQGGRVEIVVGREAAEPPSDHGGPPGTYPFLRVLDQGTGIPAEAILHLFEPFFTTKDVGEGTGLGLSVVYSIVQEHGGWITVKNRPEGGAEFTVYFPEAPSHAE